MTDPSSTISISLDLDRASTAPIGEQIFMRLKDAILSGHLPPGARLPSGRDLAVQLGVARGTVRTAFDRLADENLVYGAGAAGMRIAPHRPRAERAAVAKPALDRPLLPFGRPQPGLVLPFQMGVPSQTAFPSKVWHRIMARASRDDISNSFAYADPQGELDLRVQIARHLAISRHVQCHPDQIIITSGYRQGLAMTLSALGVCGQKAWVEDPGYPLGRRALELAGLTLASVVVDQEGLRVDQGIATAPDAKVALVTPGQQAPLGVCLSAARRKALIDWARSTDAWIIEDDYLSELQLDGRAAPALASAGADRVIHIGSFSKTLSPSLGLGFLVAPPAMVGRMVEMASVTAPAPARMLQRAMTRFLAEGQYLRHLRKMKRHYAGQRALIMDWLHEREIEFTRSGLALVIYLPNGVDDKAIAQGARDQGIAPVPLSSWYCGEYPTQPGLLLSVTNIREDNIEVACGALLEMITPAPTSGRQIHR